jgi:hypothetical protein
MSRAHVLWLISLVELRGYASFRGLSIKCLFPLLAALMLDGAHVPPVDRRFFESKIQWSKLSLKGDRTIIEYTYRKWVEM